MSYNACVSFPSGFCFPSLLVACWSKVSSIKFGYGMFFPLFWLDLGFLGHLLSESVFGFHLFSKTRICIVFFALFLLYLGVLVSLLSRSVWIFICSVIKCAMFSSFLCFCSNLAFWSIFCLKVWLNLHLFSNKTCNILLFPLFLLYLSFLVSLLSKSEVGSSSV